MLRRGPARIHANLTPMIDVTFLLIVFFVLVSQIVEVENVDLQLPALPEPESTLPGEEQRVVVNVVPALDGTATAFRAGGVSYPADARGAEALGRALEQRYLGAPNLRVSFRADRATQYASIRPALDAITAAAHRAGVVARLNLVILREESS